MPSSTARATTVPSKVVPTRTATLRKEAPLGNGVSVRVTDVEKVVGTARGPGEIAGPAARVTVRVSNKTRQRIPMDLALVNLYYGRQKTPAQVLSGPGSAPLRRPVAAGEAASGKYVFGVPGNQFDRIVVEFSYTTEAPTVVFSGSP